MGGANMRRLLLHLQPSVAREMAVARPAAGAKVRRMKHNTRILLAAALLSVAGCKSELDGKPVAKVGEVKGDVKAATDAKADVKAPAAAAAKTLKADPAASSIGFVGAKLSGDHTGSFKTFTGETSVEGTTPKSVSFSVETASLTSDDEKLTGHLKSPDFFDVEKFPKAEFVSTAIVPKTGDAGATHEVTGDLSLHGEKKAITFPAAITIDERSAKGTAEFKINRKDFKIVYPGMPDDLIKDEVLLKISLSFVP
jgi:polyisoprenoid-binding protein YceI